MINFQGIETFINDNSTTTKVLLTECEDTNEDGYDLKNIITDVVINQGDYIKMNDVTWLVLDTKKVNNSSYTLGTIREINHLNKFISNDVVYQVPSICTNISKNKLGTIYDSQGITEAQGIWSFITQYNDISKKITLGQRFIINGGAWKCTSLDHTTDIGILYVVMKVDSISTENDDMINEVAGGLSLPKYAITLSSSNESLYRGKTYQINAICTKNNVADTAPVITYSSSNPNVATVSTNGLVTAQSTIGNCVITLNYYNSSVTLNLEVIEDIYDISLAESSITKFNDETYQLNVICKKDNEIVSNPVLTYISDNTNVATVDNNGLISMVNVGTCNIIATYENISALLSLTVKPHNYEITLDNTNVNIIQDGTYNISATCKKDGVIVSNPNIVYSSSNSNIATVSNLGEITAVNVGNVDITCVYEGVNTILSVTVNAKPVIHVYTIDLSGNSNNLYLGDTLKLNAVCKDNDINVDSPVIIWSSSDTNIVSVNSNGLVSSVSLGSATITGEFNGVSTTLNLNIVEKPHVYTISLAETSKTLNVGDTYNIFATCTDNGSTVSSPVLSFVSSDSNIASVDSNGAVTTIASGSVTITVTYKNVSALVNLTVNTKVVPTYTYAFSQGTTIKQFVTSTLTTAKTVSGVVDSTLYIDYSFDSATQTLVSAGKIVVTRKSNSSISIKNASVTTVTNIYLTVTDHADGTKILDSLKITLTGM
jgi:uncharacterized protein YjdB